jgi:hypothetical protein
VTGIRDDVYLTVVGDVNGHDKQKEIKGWRCAGKTNSLNPSILVGKTWPPIGTRTNCFLMASLQSDEAQDPSPLLSPQRTKRAPGTPAHVLKTARVRLRGFGMTFLIFILIFGVPYGHDKDYA